MSARPGYPTLVFIALLGAWLGIAIFVAAVIAPAAFAVLPTRALAGVLVGRALPVLFIGGLVLGGAVTAFCSTSARVASVGGLLLLAGNAGALMIERRIHALLVAIGAPIDSLAVTDARRIEFGRQHGLSVLLMAVGVVGASTALVALLRRVHSGLAAEQTTPGSHHDTSLPALASSPS